MKSSLLLIGAVSGLLSVPASAVIVFSSTVDRRLISFDSAAPGTLLSDVPITGLGDQFESVQGIDFRPATGQLYALGATLVGVIGNGTIGVTGLAAVPEPGSIALLGLAGLVLSARQRRNR